MANSRDMGTGSYVGGHTKVFISAGGTRWEVPDRPVKRTDDLTRERWDNKLGVETGRELRRLGKETRSFISMCAMAFYNDGLSETHPKPLPRLQREIKLVGGNKNWIASDAARLSLFEHFFKKLLTKSEEPSNPSSS
jgi:hypothetical protein